MAVAALTLTPAQGWQLLGSMNLPSAVQAHSGPALIAFGTTPPTGLDGITLAPEGPALLINTGSGNLYARCLAGQTRVVFTNRV